MVKKIEKLCKKYHLGCLKSRPEAVTGGLLHKMYHVETDKGEYAVKVLNPGIMKRPEALKNTINSELVSNAFADMIPLVSAKELEGNYVTELDGSYYVIFDWLDGRSVFAPEIRVHHCEQIGRILGKIHASGMKVDGMEKCNNSRKEYDWNRLFEKAEQCNPECCSLLQENLADIIRWDKNAVKNLQQIKQTQVLSHRDLDPKNVMWKNDSPYLIDWEAAGYVNPFQELIEVLNYWISDAEGNYDKAKFDAVIQAYTENISIGNVNWDAIVACSFDGMLGWLEYSIKRAVGMEGSETADLREGLQQTKGTILELKRQEGQMEKLKSWIV